MAKETVQPSGVVSLITDFGLSDPYVGIMKGVLLTCYPKVRVVDITHGITPFDRVGAGLALRRSWRFFPKGTVHVVVVDPTVGSNREIICAVAQDHFFIVPNNGILPIALSHPQDLFQADPIDFVVQLSAVSARSTTFHGRDIFAPAGAKLAAGCSLSSLGDAFLTSNVVASELPRPEERSDGWSGRIINCDHFGNLISNIRGPIRFRTAVLVAPDGSKVMSFPIKERYGDVEVGEPVALVGSDELLELSVCQGNARDRLGMPPTDMIVNVF